MRKKKSSLTTTLIIILVIVVGAIFAYIYIQDKELEVDVEKTNNTSTKEEKKEEELALDSEEVKQAIDSFNSINGIDKYKSFKVSDIDKYGLIITAIHGLDNEQITWCISSPKQITATITLSDLNESLHKYIKDQNLTIDDIKNSKGETGLTVGDYGYDLFAITVDEDSDIHVIGSCDGSGPGVSNEITQTNLIKAVTKEDELYIYTQVAYGKINATANDLSYDYYKEFDKKNFVETVSLDGNLTWDKYNTYKQIYKKVDDKYYFASSKID